MCMSDKLLEFQQQHNSLYPSINIEFHILRTAYSLGYWNEEFFDNQKLLKLVIIPIILMTFIFDSRVIL